MFYRISKFISCKFVSKCILEIVVNAEAVTTGRMIPPGTNRTRIPLQIVMLKVLLLRY